MRDEVRSPCAGPWDRPRARCALLSLLLCLLLLCSLVRVFFALATKILPGVLSVPVSTYAQGRINQSQDRITYSRLVTHNRCLRWVAVGPHVSRTTHRPTHSRGRPLGATGRGVTSAHRATHRGASHGRTGGGPDERHQHHHTHTTVSNGGGRTRTRSRRRVRATHHHRRPLGCAVLLLSFPHEPVLLALAPSSYILCLVDEEEEAEPPVSPGGEASGERIPHPASASLLSFHPAASLRLPRRSGEVWRPPSLPVRFPAGLRPFAERTMIDDRSERATTTHSFVISHPTGGCVLLPWGAPERAESESGVCLSPTPPFRGGGGLPSGAALLCCCLLDTSLSQALPPWVRVGLLQR